MIREIKTYEFICDICDIRFRSEGTSIVLPDGWKRALAPGVPARTIELCVLCAQKKYDKDFLIKE